MIGLVVFIILLIATAFFFLDCFIFKKFNFGFSSAWAQVSIILLTLCTLSLLDVFAWNSKTSSFETYDNLMYFYNLCEENDTIDFCFYQEVLEWNEFVDTRKNKIDNLWYRGITPDWYEDLQYIEFPTNLTIVDNHNLL